MIYYSCGFGFMTFDLKEAMEYCIRYDFEIIHINDHDSYKEIGCYKFIKNAWVKENY